MEIIIFLIVAHFLCDYPLQGNYMAMAKNRHDYIKVPIPEDWPYEDKYDGMVEKKWKEWPWVLSGHATIHGGAVYLITGLWYLALLEIIIHGIIDDKKCAEDLTYNQDQAVHIACKVVWAIIATWVGSGA